MALKNSQYDIIIRDYEKKQQRNRHILEARRAAIYHDIPLFLNLDRKIGDLSVSQSKKLIMGDQQALQVLRSSIKDLTLQKQTLLMNSGYPADYLFPIFDCSICQDTGYLSTGQKCACFKQAEINILYTQSNIHDLLEQENFKHFSYEYYTPEESMIVRRIVDECKIFIENFDTVYNNLFFYGDVGIGKTFLTNCVSKELIESMHSVIYFTAFQLFDTIAKYTFDSHNSSEEIKNMYEHIFESDLLIIDDLGTETVNSFVASQLFLIVNERHLRKKSTIISTNLSLEKLVNIYSERTFSRISGNYQMFKLSGEDIRIKKKKLRNRK